MASSTTVRTWGAGHDPFGVREPGHGHGTVAAGVDDVGDQGVEQGRPVGELVAASFVGAAAVAVE
jgi:hypothetical protein